MNDPEESDGFVVPKKLANKGGAAALPAEQVEGRFPTKGNSTKETRVRAQDREALQQHLRRVREVATRDKELSFTTLWHHVYDVDHLRAVFFQLKKSAAPGVDRVTWQIYAESLEDNLLDLAARLRCGAYRAKPVLRVYIPKPDGRQRPLGIPALEDKLVQSVTKQVLEQIYETDFLGFSYGCRPERSPHRALDALVVGITRKKVNWVLDADIRGFFDAIDHDCLMSFVEQRVADQRVLRHIKKWLNAGVLEDGAKTWSESGTPQGGSISPLLANIYLHYVLDLWVEEWRRTQARGDLIVVRYVDDFVMGFQYREDALACLNALKTRLTKYRLELHPEKTRLIEFGRYATERRQGRGEGKPATFDFLGFTHFCGTTRAGQFKVGRKTKRKTATAKLQVLKELLRKRMHAPVPRVGAWLSRVLKGHYRYYGVPGNIAAMGFFRDRLTLLWRLALRRRSQNGNVTWARMNRLALRWLPQPTIQHPYPDQRFRVTTQGRSPVR
jgi:group II intron reverse transcriptase/maturase